MEKDPFLTWKEQSGLLVLSRCRPPAAVPQNHLQAGWAGNEETGEKGEVSRRKRQPRVRSHRLEGGKGVQGVNSSKEGGFPRYFEVLKIRSQK